VNPARTALRALIRAYQLLISPWFGACCRFHPTCSQYALDALETHGAVKGSALAVRRVCRCHPFNAGGFDPVPRNHRS
jgi:putative membrane protein insertion efficiency factor